MPRAVLDTNVLVSALISPGGPSAAILLELRAGAFELVTSPLLIQELADVLARPKFRTRVTPEQAAGYVEVLQAESAVHDDPVPAGLGLCADPDDEFLIDLARSAGADAIVTGDAHLLDLRATLPVITPAEFLDVLTRG